MKTHLKSMKTHLSESEIQSPAEGGSAGRPRLSRAWLLAILLALATLPYLGVLRNDFTYIYDDKAQILDNPYVHSFGHLREVLTTPVWSFRNVHNPVNYYRPVMTLGFLLCFQLFGPLAYGYHLASLLLHASVVIVIFLFAERLLRSRDAALCAAGLFALHPIHVESIAWISAVTDLELTFFYLLTFWLLVRMEDERGWRRVGTAAGMTLSFALALLSKEQALTLPLLAGIYELFYAEGRAATSRARKLERQAPLWVASLAYIGVRVHVMGTVARGPGMHPMTVWQTVLSALALVGRYLAKLFWPAHLSAFYSFSPSTRWFEPWVMAGVAGLLLCALAFGFLWKRARGASFGVLWLLVTLAPVLNAGWLGAYVFTERYFYLPSVGFCLVMGWAGAELWRAASRRPKPWKAVVVASAVTIAGLSALRIATRIPDWRDDVTLLTHALAAQPHDFILHDALGDAYWMREQPAPAEREWKIALQLNPNFTRPINGLGAALAKERRYGEALPYLERAIQLNPNDADAHMNLGALDAETGNFGGAEREFRIVESLAPFNFMAYNVLGKLYFDTGRLDQAAEQFRKSWATDPNVAAADYLGYLAERRGDTAGAEKAFRAALSLSGADGHAHYHLGLIYAAAGRTDLAAAELKAALAADPHNPAIASALEKLPH